MDAGIIKISPSLYPKNTQRTQASSLENQKLTRPPGLHLKVRSGKEFWPCGEPCINSGGVMKNLSNLIGFIFLCAVSVLFVSCYGDEYLQQTRPIDSSDEGTHAKDRSLDQSCESSELLITDCLDACSCCSDPAAAVHDVLDQCVWLCDGVLLRAEGVPNITTMNLTKYKECTVGCFSICDKPDQDITCYQECKHYLGK
jgi:hypothetical protein